MKSIRTKAIKFWSLLLFTLFFSTAAMAAGNLEINGTAAGKDGQQVKLVRYTEGSLDKLGTAVVKDGQFHISAQVDEISLAVLQIGESFGGTIILEPATLKYQFNADGSFGIKGGKYNPILSGFLVEKKFVAADALFRKLTKGGNVAAIKGTAAEWEMIQPFLDKEELRSEYLAKLVKTSKDPYVVILAAVMCELQPYPEKTMVFVNKEVPKVGENLIMVRRAKALYKQQAAALARRHAGMLGEQYTDFAAVTLEGKAVSLAPIVKANKYVLLQFWASWCGPCRKEIPLLKELYGKYKGKGLEVVSFSMDDNKNNWEKASEVEKLQWINISDLKAFGSSITKHYPIFGIPANVIIDQQGKIVASNLTDKDLEDKVYSLLK